MATFEQFYRGFKNFTLSKNDKEFCSNLGITPKELQECRNTQTIPLDRLIEYCKDRMIPNPMWVCSLG